MSLSDIRDRISKAEAKTGRAVGSVQLIAVSKVQPLARGAIEQALQRQGKLSGATFTRV